LSRLDDMDDWIANWVYMEDFDPFPLPVQAAAPAAHDRHQPVFTTEMGADLILTIIRVDLIGRRPAYQIYTCASGTWALTGYFGTMADACSELQSWREYVSRGGSLTSWLQHHPDGVENMLAAR
jgi:hypothetical protein